MKHRGLLLTAGLLVFFAFLSFLLPKSGPPPTADSPDHAATLRVVSDAPGAPPIPGARVLGGMFRTRTGADGRASVPQGAAVRLAILAPGHVGTEGAFSLNGPEQVVVLKRTGAAVFTALDADGAPVEGLSLRLEPRAPVAGLVPGLEPQKTTDSSGVARWTDLIPGAVMEWTCTSGHPIEPGPGIDAAHAVPIQVAGGGWAVPSEPDAARGSFTVEGGKEHALTLRIRRSSTLTLRLRPGPDAGGSATVQIVSRRDVETPSGPIRDDRVERTIDADVGAPISIPNLTPGRKVVRIGWWDAPNRRAFARRQVDLEAGATYDLGTLEPAPGHPVDLLLKLEGPSELLDRLDKPVKATVAIVAPAATEQFQAPVGEPLTVSGISADRVTVLCLPELKYRNGQGSPRVEPLTPLEIALPAESRLEIPIRILKE